MELCIQILIFGLVLNSCSAEQCVFLEGECLNSPYLDTVIAVTPGLGISSDGHMFFLENPQGDGNVQACQFNYIRSQKRR